MFAKVEKSGTLRDILPRTRFANSPETMAHVVHWNTDGTIASFIFQDGQNGLQMHLEHLDNGASYQQLKKKAESILQEVLNIAKKSNNKIDSSRIEVFAKDKIFSVGKHQTFWKSLKQQLAEKVLSILLVSLTSAIVLVCINKSSTVGISSFLVILAALLTQTIIKAGPNKGKIVYTDV